MASCYIRFIYYLYYFYVTVVAESVAETFSRTGNVCDANPDDTNIITLTFIR